MASRDSGSLRIAIVLAVLVILTTASFSQAAQYPPSRGVVSDYADKLSPTQVAELTSLSQVYERQTSIEITVVVASSLQGQSAQGYATGIGDAWGVGKAGRNNGVVLLWAPNERAYSLRIADGLSQELSDADATDITRNNLLPNFRRGDYYEGLKETVTAVMQRLGNESWEERLRLRQEKSQSSPDWLNSALIAGLSVALIVVAVVMISRRGRRSLRLREMAAAPESITRNLHAARENASSIQQLLDDFKTEMPEQDVTRFASKLAEQPARITKIELDATFLDAADLTSYEKLLDLKDRAEEEANLLGNIRSKLDEIRQAKTQSQQLLQRLSSENFQITTVRDGSKTGEVNNLLSNGRSLYNQAYQNSSMSILDWIVISNLLNNSHQQVQQALQVSQAAPYTPPPTFGSGSYGSDTSTFGSSGDSGGGGGFSGGSGGGGDFGGGGGFSGGSGSSGSY